MAAIPRAFRQLADRSLSPRLHRGITASRKKVPQAIMRLLAARVPKMAQSSSLRMLISRAPLPIPSGLSLAAALAEVTAAVVVALVTTAEQGTSFHRSLLFRHCVRSPAVPVTNTSNGERERAPSGVLFLSARVLHYFPKYTLSILRSESAWNAWASSPLLSSHAISKEISESCLA
jgi:hypothetical protein